MYGAPDLKFDFAAAKKVVSAATNAANSLEGQSLSRAGAVGQGAADFSGYYSQLFAANARSAAYDQNTLVIRLREITVFMNTLIASAHAENTRRKKAREWKARVEARRSNWVDATWDSIFGLEPPPRQQPEKAPSFHTHSVSNTPREPLAGSKSGSRSSADPSHLRSFATTSANLDQGLSNLPGTLNSAAGVFMTKCDFGGIDVSTVVSGLEQWLQANANDVVWANAVAAAFEAIGSGVVSLSDSALSAALASAGATQQRESLTVDPAKVFGGSPTSGFANDPVNTATGNFIEPEVDLSGVEASAELTLSRMYNSLNGSAGVFGPGWSSVLDVRLELGNEGAVLVLPDGREVHFPRRGAQWERAEGECVWLQREPAANIPALRHLSSELVVARDNRGGWWAFTPAGVWLGRGSGPGSAVLVHRDDEGRVVSLAHERGRRIDISYRGARVCTAVTSDSRRVDYDYDDSSRLVGATGGEGTRVYGWNPEGLLYRVVSAAGVLECENTYDDLGRVTEQVTQFGRRVRFVYLPGRVTAVSDMDGSHSNTWVADKQGRLISVIDANDRKQSMSYDDQGNLVSVIERDGTVTVHAYDDRGRRTRTVTPEGADITYGYDDHDRVVTVVSESGGVMEYDYAAPEDRHPSRITDPCGGLTLLTWRGGLLQRVQDPMGVSVSFEYDEHGDLVLTRNSAGDAALIERDDHGRPVVAEDPSGARTRFRYDPRGLLASREDPEGAVWRYEADRAGRLASTTDPLGATTRFEYGPHGAATRVVDPLGRVTEREYDTWGNLAAVILPDGAQWLCNYDGLSRLREVTDPGGNVWTHEYDPAGFVQSIIDPTGVRSDASRSRSDRVSTLRDAFGESTLRCDQFGRPVEAEAPDGSTEMVVFDACGRPVEYLDADGGLTRVVRDLAGRVVSVATPSGRVSRYEYDECGRPAASIDPDGTRTVLTYDACSRVVSRVCDTGETACVEYDRLGRVTRVSESGRGVSSFGYDKVGRIVWVRDPWLGHRRFRYDAAGQLVGVVNGVGGVTQFEYDERGRVVRSTDPLGGVTATTYTQTDEVSSVTDALGRAVSMKYDAAGRMVWRRDQDGGVTEWSYDFGGEVAQVSAGGRVVIEVARDVRERTVLVTDRTRRGHDPVEHCLRFSRVGRLVERSRADRVMRWEYDSDGLRTAFVGPDGIRTEYGWDAAGRLAGVERSGLGAVSVAYDAAGRVIRAVSGDSSQEWQYGQGGVRSHTCVRGDDVQVTVIDRDCNGRVIGVDDARYEYDGAGQLVTMSTPRGATQWEYDLAGRLIVEITSDGVRRFTYDSAGQLVSVTGPRDEVTRFECDELGRRVRAEGPQGVREWEWDERGGLREYRTGNESIHLWVDALGELAEINGGRVEWDSAAAWPSLCAVGSTPVVSAPGFTGIGDSWVPTGWRFSRVVGADDPWGGAAGSIGAPGVPGDVGVSAGGGVVAAGLEWLNARVYDPETRGFVSPDPLPCVSDSGWSGNRYAYAGNDPVHWVDPLGLRPVTDAELAEYARAHRGFVGDVADGLNTVLTAAKVALDVQIHQAQQWWDQNWEYVVAGAAIAAGAVMIAAGAALTLTGVGAPLGLALGVGGGALFSGGVSVATQKITNGSVDWGEVGVQTLIGGASGLLPGVGGLLASGASKFVAPLVTNVAVNGGLGAVFNGGAYAVTHVGQFNGRDFAGALGSGFVSGAIGGLAGPAGGTIARAVGQKATGFLARGSSLGISAVGGAGGSVAGDVIAGRPVDPLVTGVNAVAGAGGDLATIGLGKLGYGMSGVDTLKQMPVAHPRTLEGAFDLNRVNTRGLWFTGTAGNVVGSVPAWIPGF